MTGLTPAAAVRRARGMHEALRSMASSPGSLHLPASLPAKSSALSSSSSSPSSTSLSTSDARVSGAAPSVNPPASPTTVDGVKATIKPGQPNKSQEALLRRKAKELGFDLPPPEMLMTEFLNGREEVEMRIFLEDVVKLKPIPAIKYAFSSVVQQTICVCVCGGGHDFDHDGDDETSMTTTTTTTTMMMMADSAAAVAAGGDGGGRLHGATTTDMRPDSTRPAMSRGNVSIRSQWWRSVVCHAVSCVCPTRLSLLPLPDMCVSCNPLLSRLFSCACKLVVPRGGRCDVLLADS